MLFRSMLFSLLIMGVHPIFPQVVTCVPENPTAEDTITLTFYADHGNQALKNYEGEVYFHTGVITGTRFEPSGWRFVQGNWGEADPRVRMQRIGPNTYEASFHIRSFYGLPETESFFQMGLVFRNEAGTLVGKTEDEGDIFYPDIPKYPNGPLELADGRDGEFLSSLPDRKTLFDGRLFLSNEKQSISISKYPGGIVNVLFQPHQSEETPYSEAVIVPADNSSIFKEIKPGKPGNQLSLGDTDLMIFQEPFNLALIRKNHPILTLEKGFFFDDQDSLLGPVTGLRLQLEIGEEIYGGGSRAIPTNRRGERFYLYNTANYGYSYGETALNISIPFFISSAGYGLLIDSYRPGYVDLGKTKGDVWEIGIQDTLLSIFLIPGHTPKEILRKFTALTGRQPLPPLWSLGYIQSRFGYRNQEEALDITRRTQEAGIPLDAILLDLYWFGGKEQMGDFTWQKDDWPDPAGMVDQLEQNGVKTILISESYFVEGTRYWDELVEQDLLATDSDGKVFVIPDFWAGPAGILDVFQPEARQWFWKLYRQQMEANGIRGWWCDSGEPENHPTDMEHIRGSARDVHNLYSNYWSRLLKEGYQKDFPDRRLFNLNRSGWVGMQRFSVFPWSGDVSRSWDAFRAQLPIMLGAGLVGIPYMHSDLGGFTGGPKDEELYTRWVQMGTFVPIMRVHGDALGIEPEPIFYSTETQRRVRDAILLRYQLLPYTYTLSHEAYRTGLPLARSLVLESLSKKANTLLDRQYFWGDDLMVAPVLEKGATEKRVFLPEGRWYDWYSGERFAGGRVIEVEVNLDRIPVFARAGAAVPINPTPGNSEYWARNTSAWRIFLPGENGLYTDTAFVDDGEMARTIENQHYTLFYAETQREDNVLFLQIKQTVGQRSDLEGEKVYIELAGLQEAPIRVRWQGKGYSRKKMNRSGPEGPCWWDADRKLLIVKGPWRGSKNQGTIRLR